MTQHEVKARLHEFQNELWHDYMEVNRPTKVYHYTDLTGLEGILNSRELWLSDVRYLRNDPTDGRYWEGVIRDVLNRKSVDRKLRAVFNRGNVIALGQELFAYVASFSERNNIRNQWQSFTGGSKGVAIEFDFAELFDGAEQTKTYALFRVLYNRREQDDKVTKTIDNAIQVLRSIDITAEDRDSYWFEVFMTLVNCGSSFKEPQFSAEKEWRIWMLRQDTSCASIRKTHDGMNI